MERVASRRSGQRMTETTRKRLFRLQNLSCSRSWNQNIVDCHQEGVSMLGTLRGTKGSGWVSHGQTPSTLLGQKMTQWRREQSESWNRRKVEKLRRCSKYRKCLATCYLTHRTVRPRRHHQHKLRAEFRSTRTIKLRPIPEVNRRL